jgi:hypothetical protein
MKLVLAVLGLLGVASAQSDFEKVKQCIYAKCPSQSAKCDASCEAKLEKCANKCGLKVDQVCWGGCVGLIGPATNVALCAANNGCLASSNQFSFEEVGRVIDQFIRKEPWLQ